MTDKPNWLQLARDAYSASNTYFDASIRHQIEADLRQFQGLHPSGSKYLADVNRSRSKLFRPKTRTTIRKNEAVAAEAFFSTNDVVSIKPENDNDAVQKASAEVMSELLQYRLTKSIPWFLTLVGAYQDAQTVGMVASYQYWEFNQKKNIDRPCIRLVPVENIRFDPGASWTDPVGTSPYLIEMIPMYVKDVKARMATVDSKTGEAKWKTLPDATILTAVKQYGDTIRLQREGQRTDSKDQAQANNNFSIVWVHKNIIEVDGDDMMFYTLGTEQILSEPVPLSDAYFHGRRPYVIGSCIIETHKNYPSSLPRISKDVQAEINEVANQRIDNVKLVMNKKYFAKRNKQVDIRSLTRNVPGSVTLMQDTDDVKVVEFNDVTGSSYKEQEVLNLDFDDITGAFSGASVQSNRKLNETVGGMDLLSSGANQVSGYQLRTFVETWVEPVLRQIVLLEQYYETDETLIGLCGEKAKLLQKFGVDAVTDAMLMNEFTLNVNVGMGASNPKEQVKNFIQGMTALRDMLADGSLLKFGLSVEEVIKELFGKLGYKDGGRFFDTEKQDPMVVQLQATVQELQQALQAKVDPKLVEAQIRKIDAEIASYGVKDIDTQAAAVKKGVEAAFSAMQAAEVLAAVPQVAPIADELMKAAGYTAPAGGMDPNYPAGDGIGAMSVQPISNKKTGIGFTPGAPGDTTPLTPAAPITPGVGAQHGIETKEADSVPGLADGGLIGIDGLTDEQRTALQYGTHPTMPAAPKQQAFREPSITGPGASLMNSLSAGGTIDPNRTSAASGAFKVGGVDDNVFNYNLSGQTVLSDPLKPFSGMNSPTYSAYANGGEIQGPGTGTSDSIPAVVDGQQPIAVSDGEYHVPAQVVAALGRDFFETLVMQFHQEAGSNTEMPADMEPIGMQSGDFIVPADVVQALGVEFFDNLVQKFGTAA